MNFFLTLFCVLSLIIHGSQALAQTKGDEMKAIVQETFEKIWNGHEFDRKFVSKVFDQNYVLHDNGRLKYEGFDGLENFFNIVLYVVPDFQVKIDDQIAEGDIVATRWTAKGTHKGRFIDVDPTGKVMEWTGITLSHFSNGKILKEWVYYDVYGLLYQMGKTSIMKQEIFNWGPPSEIKGNPGDPKSNKAIVMRYDEAWYQHKTEDLDNIFSVDVINHIAGVWKGIEGQKWLIDYYCKAFPDLQGTAEYIAEGDLVVEHWTATGTHQDEIYGLKPTGKRVEFKGITIYRIADGKIVETWWANDFYGLLLQLGAF